jgi:hypothetical protein
MLSRFSLVVAAACIAAVSLAGCSGGGEGGGQTQTTETLGPIAAGKGAISGLLINDVFRPVPGGLILIQDLGLTATSDDSGQFVFLDVEPGSYLLRVQADGHEAAPQTVDVEEGEYAEVELIARRVASDGGRIISNEFSVFVSCNVNAVVIGLPFDCTGDLSGDSDRAAFYSDYNGTSGVTYLVTEMKANQVGNYEVRIRPSDHGGGASGNYAVMEIVESDYLRIVHKVGEVAHEPYELTGNNIAWNNTGEFVTIFYVDSIGKQETGTFGAGADVGVRAKFVQSVFVGEPETDIETYCVLC